MEIISGRDVDLLTPFPAAEYKRVFGWLRCYRTLVETTAFPKTEEEFAERFAKFKNIQTFGIIDKNNILSIRHEAPLVGIYMFDQDTLLNGNAHVACTRKAWGSRLVDQAGQLLIKHVFDTNPALTRVSVVVLSNNAPAKGLAKRLGFMYEGCLRDAITVNDTPANMSLFGLTRREWTDKNLANQVIEPIPMKPKEEPVEVA